MKRYFIFTVLVFFLICIPSNALYHQQENLELGTPFFLSGNSLLSMLEAMDNIEIADLHIQVEKSLEYNIGLGYSIGVWDALVGILWQGSKYITRKQIADVARKYLEDNPERRDQPARDLLGEAFSEAFPKKKEGES